MLRICKLFKFCIIIILLFLFIINYCINFETKNDDEICDRLHGSTVELFNNLTSPTVIVSQKERMKLGLKDLVVVSFASLDHIGEAMSVIQNSLYKARRSCDTFQQHPQLKNTTFIMYFADTVTADVQMLFGSLCPVAQLRTLDLNNYPKYIQDLQQYRFKAIYQALTLKDYSVVLNIDASVRFVESIDFDDLIKTAIKQNPTDVTLLSASGHNMVTTTHPIMYNCFPNITKSEISNLIQYQSGIILWISSAYGWKVMKKFVECALQRKCMAPLGSKKTCNTKNILKYPKKFSGCHRFDQAAINLILYEASNHNPSEYQWPHPGFLIQRSPKLL